MSSAAKLRYIGRGTAVVASAALVMTSFGPAAFGWNPVAPTPTAANMAGAASIGVIDANDNKADTQGATVVAPGQQGAAIGDVRFVIPSTFQTGDTIDFTLGDAADLEADTGLTGTAAQANIISKRVSFAGQPQVAIDRTPYADTTHVQSTSPTPTTAAAVGSVEAGRESRYAGAGTPVAPQFTVSLASAGAEQFNNVLRITFTNNSDPSVNTAKFIGAINGATINVGSNVEANQDLGLTAAVTAGPDQAGVPNGDATNVLWFGADANDRTTYPATIATARLDVTNGAVVADGSAQYVGPVTVTSSAPMSGPVEWTLTGGTFDPNAPITATAYNAAGTVVGTPTAGNATINAANNTVSYSPGAAAVRVVFSGAAVRTMQSQLVYTLTQDGSGDASPTGFLGSTDAANFALVPENGDRNQRDIERPTASSQVSATTTVVPTRIGGTDRFETAVKVAEADRGANSVVGARGEADNVIIASGQTFPDALSAGYLAATKDAPILLTTRDTLPQTVREFLKNYGAKNVYIVGGASAVSGAVETALRETQAHDVQAKQQTQQVTRTVYDVTIPVADTGPAAAVSLAGLAADPSIPASVSVTTPRTGTGAVTADTVTTSIPGATVTNAAIADGAAGTATVTLATGESFTVQIPASSVTSGNQTTTFATQTTSRQITRTENVPGAVTDETASGDDRMVVPLQANLQVMRLAGADRFETNRKVNEYAGVTSQTPIGTMVSQYGQPAKKTALIANGLTPWDALAAGPLVGNGGGDPIPLILTAGGSLHSEAKRQVQTMDIANAVLIGGDTVVPGGVASELTSLGTTSNRLSGADRWGTARAITEFALKSSAPSTTNTAPGLGFAPHSPLLVNGGAISLTQRDDTKWADALTAGAWAARENATIALTTTNQLPEATKQMLTANAATFDPLVAIGLGHAVSTEVLNEANKSVAG